MLNWLCLFWNTVLFAPDSTRKCLSDLKDLMETRKKMEEEGLLDPKELRRKILMEEQMKWEITQILRHSQKKETAKREAERKELGKMAYKLERKMREVQRLKEEEEYRRQVDERYEQRIRQEREGKGEAGGEGEEVKLPELKNEKAVTEAESLNHELEPEELKELKSVRVEKKEEVDRLGVEKLEL